MPHRFRYRTIRLVASIGALLLVVAAARAASWIDLATEILAGSPPRMIVIWVDKSDSITASDWDLYSASFNVIVDALRPGDRAVLASVGTDTLTRFTPLDKVLPNSGVTLADRSDAKNIRDVLKAAFTTLRKSNLEKTTNLLDTFNAVDQLFASASGFKSRRLVYFSDMIHQADGVDFARSALDDAFYEKLVKQRKGRQLLPKNLAGAEVFVVGATAKNATKYTEIKSFWQRYVRDFGGNLTDAHYGRSVAVVMP